MRGRSGSVLGRLQYGDTRSRGDGHHYSQPGRWAAGPSALGYRVTVQGGALSPWCRADPCHVSNGERENRRHSC